MIVHRMFRDLDDSAPMSADQLKRFIAHMDTAAADLASHQAWRGRAGVARRADQGRAKR